MPHFYYKAQSEDGSYVSGVMEVGSPIIVATELGERGYIPISIKEKKGLLLSKLDFSFERIRLEDLIFFTRQLRALIKSGIPILSGLKAIAEQTDNKRLKIIILEVCNDLDQGISLSSALSRHPKVFNKIYSNMVYTGEMGGNLQDILERLVYVLEFNRKTVENLKAAIRYPIIVIVTLCTAFAFLVTFVLPKFAVIFESSKVALPLPTRIMMNINFSVQNYWYYLLGIIALLVVSFFLYTSTKFGRLNWDHFKLKIPILGLLLLKIYMSRFSAMLEALIRSGVPIVNALEIVSGTIGNEYIAMKVKEISEKVKTGRGIAEVIRESEVFPPLVVQMVLTGEKAGSLDDMLQEVSDYYEKEIDYAVSRLSSYIEPILTVTLGIMVLFFALAIFLPWWDMIKVFQGGM